MTMNRPQLISLQLFQCLVRAETTLRNAPAYAGRKSMLIRKKITAVTS